MPPIPTVLAATLSRRKMRDALLPDTVRFAGPGPLTITESLITSSPVVSTIVPVTTKSMLSVPAAAFASPTVNTLGGDTRVQLSADLVGALTSLGVSVKASYPARLRGASASFPIPGGELDLGTLKGEVDHAGGLTLRAGATEVNLSSYTIDTTGAAPVLTGLVKVNDSVLGRLPLFDITLVSAPVVRGLHARAGSVQLDNVRLTLNDEAAVALDAVFNVSAFQAGLPVGTARVQTYFYEPAP